MLTEFIDRVEHLIEQGVLGSELCPAANSSFTDTLYWHWPVLKAEELPADMKKIFDEFGEIRWYWQ